MGFSIGCRRFDTAYCCLRSNWILCARVVLNLHTKSPTGNLAWSEIIWVGIATLRTCSMDLKWLILLSHDSTHAPGGQRSRLLFEVFLILLVPIHTGSWSYGSWVHNQSQPVEFWSIFAANQIELKWGEMFFLTNLKKSLCIPNHSQKHTYNVVILGRGITAL